MEPLNRFPVMLNGEEDALFRQIKIALEHKEINKPLNERARITAAYIVKLALRELAKANGIAI